MMFGGYDAQDAYADPYVYKGTDCLKNRLKLRSSEVLQAFELEMSSLRASEGLPAGRFGPAHYQRIHWHIFQDVYAWAGRYRTIRTAKGGNWFCFPEHIATQMDQLFARLHTPNFLPGVDADTFIFEATVFLSELNAIHPFREGNGRAQLSFLHLVAVRAEHPLKLADINPPTFLQAMIESFEGQLDALRNELGALCG